MKKKIVEEVARLRCMSLVELRTRYAEVFGEEPRCRNKDYLWKRIAFRVQVVAEGRIHSDLSSTSFVRDRPSSSVAANSSDGADRAGGARHPSGDRRTPTCDGDVDGPTWCVSGASRSRFT